MREKTSACFFLAKIKSLNLRDVPELFSERVNRHKERVDRISCLEDIDHRCFPTGVEKRIMRNLFGLLQKCIVRPQPSVFLDTTVMTISMSQWLLTIKI